MTNAQWFLVVGFLLLARGLSSTMLKRLPVTSSMVYLAVGLLVGPSMLNLFHFDPLEQSALLEVLTEVAVLISLFSAGVKMPAPFTWQHWRVPIRLAWISMTFTVLLVAAFTHLVFNMPWGLGILLGAILAPTDPVLATDVQSRYPGDADQLRFTLTCEAGMNDGAAFPFIMLGLGLLGLHELGDAGIHWLLVDVLWASAAAIIIGLVCGSVLARLGWKLRGAHGDNDILDDLVGLGLIALVYGLCLLVNAWGFLAVFFAAVGLRQTEVRLAYASMAKKPLDGSSGLIEPTGSEDQESPPIVSEQSLIFKEHLERLSEMMLILLLGGMVLISSWNWKAVLLALFLFVVARPFSVFLSLLGTGTSLRVLSLTGWFGVRGIGSLYYLMYAVQHGLPKDLALVMIQMTLMVVTLSILLHGISVKPLMGRFWRRRKQR